MLGAIATERTVDDVLDHVNCEHPPADTLGRPDGESPQSAAERALADVPLETLAGPLLRLANQGVEWAWGILDIRSCGEKRLVMRSGQVVQPTALRLHHVLLPDGPQ